MDKLKKPPTIQPLIFREKSKIQSILNLMSPLGITTPPLLLGSQAAAAWLPSFRPPQDTDIIMAPNDIISLVSRNIIKIHLLSFYDKLGVKVSGSIRKNGCAVEIEVAMHRPTMSLLDEQDRQELQGPEISLQEETSTEILIQLASEWDKRIYLTGWTRDHCAIEFKVAPPQVLEALKTSHIYWPYKFDVHIQDLHTFRAFLDPLCHRSDVLEQLIRVRGKEREWISGVPGHHINLAMTNEDFLDKEDNLFVKRLIPHDNLHKMVAYQADQPIYETLKIDKSQAYVPKRLFDAAPLDIQLKCVREEAMVIALERYLLPKIAWDPQTAYKAALNRICTTLTKGYFRKFAVDHYMQLNVLDKDLTGIMKQVWSDHEKQDIPPPVFKGTASDYLDKFIPDFETRLYMKQYLDSTTFSFRATKSEPWPDESRYGYNDSEYNTGFFFILIKKNNETDRGVLFCWTAISGYHGQNDCLPFASWMGCITAFVDVTEDKAKEIMSSGTTLALAPKPPNKDKQETFVLGNEHKFLVSVECRSTGGSWGAGDDIWGDCHCYAKSLEDVFKFFKDETTPSTAQPVDFFHYAMAWFNPKLYHGGNAPIERTLHYLKANKLVDEKDYDCHPWAILRKQALCRSDGEYQLVT